MTSRENWPSGFAVVHVAFQLYVTVAANAAVENNAGITTGSSSSSIMMMVVVVECYFKARLFCSSRVG